MSSLDDKVINACVNLFAYNLRAFPPFAGFEPRQLSVQVNDSQIEKSDVHIVNVETPDVNGEYIQFIANCNTKGIVNFLIAFCKKPQKD